MVATIRLLQSQADDLAAICALGEDALTRVAHAITNSDLTIKRGRIREIVSSIVGDAESQVLSRTIFGLASVNTRKADSAKETIASISGIIKSRFSGDNRFSAWDGVSSCLLNILTCKSVYYAAKAFDVAYDFERLLTEARIITSVRPIYTDGRDDIVGNTVVQTLRLEYMSAGGDSDSISIALDLSDLTKLCDICNQAIDKAKLAREKLLDGWKDDVVMAAENLS